MPELAALERVAKTLLVYDYDETSPSAVPKARIDLKALAAALAACALEEAKWWADGMHAAGGGEICKFCERIELLERAVGEKSNV